MPVNIEEIIAEALSPVAVNNFYKFIKYKYINAYLSIN